MHGVRKRKPEKLFTCCILFEQLIVLVNGGDMFQYELKHPPMTNTKPEQYQYFVGGGAVSSHTSERHITLVNAVNSSISWKLSVLSILPGNNCCNSCCYNSLASSPAHRPLPALQRKVRGHGGIRSHMTRIILVEGLK